MSLTPLQQATKSAGENAIARARIEYQRNGRLALDTVMELSSYGYIVTDLEALFEKEEKT
jgi:hypothetical protein